VLIAELGTSKEMRKERAREKVRRCVNSVHDNGGGMISSV
jgi:hypothetical protein